LLNNAGFSDWVSAVNVIESDLRAVGIQVTPDNLSGSTYSTDIADGRFQLNPPREREREEHRRPAPCQGSPRAEGRGAF
jgi:hypothetical protein